MRETLNEGCFLVFSETAALDSRDNNLLPSGAQALAGLKDATALHTVTLNLGHNLVGDSGAQALAELKDAAALHTLTLNLDVIDNEDFVVRPLFKMVDVRVLRKWMKDCLIPSAVICRLQTTANLQRQSH